MTWLEFKTEVEQYVKDEDKIWYIDIAFDEDLNIVKDKCGWRIS